MRVRKTQQTLSYLISGQKFIFYCYSVIIDATCIPTFFARDRLANQHFWRMAGPSGIGVGDSRSLRLTRSLEYPVGPFSQQACVLNLKANAQLDDAPAAGSLAAPSL